MSILGPIWATEERYRQRQEDRRINLTCLKRGQILNIAANTPDLVRRRMQERGGSLHLAGAAGTPRDSAVLVHTVPEFRPLAQLPSKGWLKRTAP